MRRLLTIVAAGLVLAGCAGDIPYAELEAKYAGPAARYMELPGGLRVHYRDEGRRDGPVLVMVHGFAASLHTWEPWVRRLSADYRIVTLDLPGHGLTRTPDGYVTSLDGHAAAVAAVTDRLALPRFVLIGNSMGGATAWTYALAHPERMRGLVLVNSAGWPRDEAPKSQPLAFRMMRNPVGRAVLRNVNPRPVAEPGLKAAYLDESLVTDGLVTRYVDLARAPGRREMILAQQALPRRKATAATFAAIKVPTLVMHGDADSVIPVADGRGLAAAIPGAKLIVYPKVGHVPMEQIPDRSAQDLRAFVESLP
jgi:pimeloyl-ACP methyl ester carboxylesterase